MTETAIETSGFRRYDHLVRLGHDDAAGIQFGTVVVYPKLDGTNASMWWHGEAVRCGSRNRTLTLDADNAGFAAWAHSDDPKATALRAFVEYNPDCIVYGEWLVPHTLQTYRSDAWRRFWVFDVFDRSRGRYLDTATVVGFLGGKADVIDPLCTIKDPSEDQLRAQVATNTFLIADGAGLGEGVVLKNYAWANNFGRQPWAKVVRNEFKEENARAFGTTEKNGPFCVEAAIVEEYVTPALVGKTRAKIILDLANDNGIDTTDPNWQQRVSMTHRGRIIPQLLGRVFYDLVNEEAWGFVKKYLKDSPTINFRDLNGRTIKRVKELAQDLF